MTIKKGQLYKYSFDQSGYSSTALVLVLEVREKKVYTLWLGEKDLNSITNPRDVPKEYFAETMGYYALVGDV